MAAGLGFKDFVTGEVLTAADVDGYLMQGVWVFASAAARDAAVTSPQEGNFAYLKDTNVTTYYTGSAWANLDTTGMTNPMTTTGDIIYSSPGSTPVRLGIGSTGNVLTVASGVPSWAAPAGGGSGLTFISRTAFSNQSSQIFDSVFTSTYDNYIVVVEDFCATASADDWQMQMRHGSTTETGAVYSGNSITTDRTSSSLTNTQMNDTTLFTLAPVSGDSNQRSAITINFTNVGNASENARFYGVGHVGATVYGALWFGGACMANQTYTGFLFKSASSNINGVVTVYGLAKS